MAMVRSYPSAIEVTPCRGEAFVCLHSRNSQFTVPKLTMPAGPLSRLSIRLTSIQCRGTPTAPIFAASLSIVCAQPLVRNSASLLSVMLSDLPEKNRWHRGRGACNKRTGAGTTLGSQIFGDVPDPMEVGGKDCLIQIGPKPWSAPSFYQRAGEDTLARHGL